MNGLIFDLLLLQCLVNVLKSLVDWEMSRRENEKKSNQSLVKEANSQESIEVKSKDATTDDFEKAKAHKSTLEAAVSEVIHHIFHSACMLALHIKFYQANDLKNSPVLSYIRHTGPVTYEMVMYMADIDCAVAMRKMDHLPPYTVYMVIYTVIRDIAIDKK